MDMNYVPSWGNEATPAFVVTYSCEEACICDIMYSQWRPKRTVVPTGITKCVRLHNYVHSSAASYSILVPELFAIPVCRKITNEGEDCQSKYGTYVSICCFHVQITLLPVSIAFGVPLRCVVLGVYHRYPVANDCIPSYNFGWPQVIVYTHFQGYLVSEQLPPTTYVLEASLITSIQ